MLAELELPAGTARADAERVLTGSEFLCSVLGGDAPLRAGFAEAAAAPHQVHELAVHLTDALAQAGGDEASVMRVLRVARRRSLSVIAWRDLMGHASVEETLSALSAVADTLIEAALNEAERAEQSRAGVPRTGDGAPQRLVVLGLGKLGSLELNFSSDIDLIFAFPETGTTDHPSRPLANEAYFLRVARRFIKLVAEPTEDGFVYRVDMRLRPFGAGGALVGSFDQLEAYYQHHGRDWERFALIRARAVAGDRSGADFLDRLRPFVYRRYLDFAALTSLRELKQSISQALRGERNDPDAADIKRGWGGIRELEFIVQAFQLLRGAALPQLQGGPILDVLPRLAERGLITCAVCLRLADAYRFLRRLENCLQAVRDEQTHRLPGAPEPRARIAALLGFTDWTAFAKVLEMHRREVREQFGLVLGAPEKAVAAENEATSAFAGIWGAAVDLERVCELLTRGGFEDASGLAERLANLRNNWRVGTLGERAYRQLGKLLALVLDEVVAQAAPQHTVSRVLAIVEGILQRTAYLALLTERPVACRQLVRLCAASPWLAQYLASHPQTFDELLDPRTLYAPPERAELVGLLDARLQSVPPEDPELEPDALRYFQQANVLRVAAAEIAEAIPLMIVSDRLTDIAETCIDKVRSLAWRDMVSRHGRPWCVVDGERRTAPFGIVAYGKLGGIELSYGSDLDLVFIHGSRGEQGMTDGERCLDNATFFARLAQRIIHYLSAYTAAGRLYEVDSRLRPNGSAGLLVTSIEAFADYQMNAAWTWEHQALVRARYVSGDAEIGARFDTVRRDVLLKPREPRVLRTEVREMRARMHTALGSGASGAFDLKQDPGGIADIEFLVQYGVLRWARSLGEAIVCTDNVRLLEGIETCGVATPEQAAFLADAYRAYRSRVHELDLQALPSSVSGDEFGDTRAKVRAMWHEWMDD